MKQKPYSSPELDKIRQRIDALDGQIHDALMERAELVLKIGEEKKKNNIQIVQPAREARMIRRLLDRHNGVLPQMAVVRIWRELVGAVSLLQTGLKVAVTVEDHNHNFWDLSRDYFGSCLPFIKCESSLTALAAVRDGRANFAVLPWPEDDDEKPWWLQLDDAEKDALRIIISLPHGRDPKESNHEAPAVIVSTTGFDDSDEDRSFLMVACDSTISRAKLLEETKNIGFTPASIRSCKSKDETPSRHLIEVEGYVAVNDERIAALYTILGDSARVIPAGGYPVPPVYAKTVRSPA